MRRWLSVVRVLVVEAVKYCASRFWRWAVKLWLCRLWSSHEWTSAAQQGVAPTKEQLAGGITGFWDYAKMYCTRCGHVSGLSKAIEDKDHG
jgi:hypothetical protein